LDIEVPKDLNFQKIDEITKILKEKMIYYLNKIREFLKNKDEYVNDKFQLIAEFMAFDYIFQKYNLEREVIEKSIYQLNLTIVEN
jgi:hypothetical protein